MRRADTPDFRLHAELSEPADEIFSIRLISCSCKTSFHWLRSTHYKKTAQVFFLILYNHQFVGGLWVWGSGLCWDLERNRGSAWANRLGRGTTLRHHLPGLQVPPHSHWPALFGGATLNSSSSSDCMETPRGRNRPQPGGGEAFEDLLLWHLLLC